MKDWLATSTYVVPLDDEHEHDPENAECWWDGDILVHNAAAPHSADACINRLKGFSFGYQI